ncbi:glycerate kinase [Nocardioides terrigena]|uniref:glycerate kinase n=1 Tax=Nocardioides terrigena TaxID=424797 RepID=UPI000D31F2C7|nr:glycerate kinase [Nocardioides terrigena]
MPTATVLLAPDKFKGSLDAAAVARHLAEGIRSADAGVVVLTCPIADGGEGTVSAAIAAGWDPRTTTVEGPTGRPVFATYAVRGTCAIVELAESSGLHRLPYDALAPWSASTYGLGQTINAAVAAGATTVVVGLGGSASTDGGSGLLQALGAVILDGEGHEIGRGARHLGRVGSIDLARAHALLGGVRLVAACDVTNPLLGRTGAAHVFGPQKGFAPDDLLAVEAGLHAFGQATARHLGRDLTEVDGAGAAGGAGHALLALGAEFRPGIDVVADVTGLHDHLAKADLVVVGEGRLDEQSLAGKGPLGVTRLAQASGVPAVAVVGRCDLTPTQLREVGLAHVMELQALQPDPSLSITQAPALLEDIGRRIALMTATQGDHARS